MAYFQAKIDWERPRKIENKKKIVPMSSYPSRNRKFQNKQKKIQIIKKHYYGIFSRQIGWERSRKRENKKKSFQ